MIKFCSREFLAFATSPEIQFLGTLLIQEEPDIHHIYLYRIPDTELSQVQKLSRKRRFSNHVLRLKLAANFNSYIKNLNCNTNLTFY